LIVCFADDQDDREIDLADFYHQAAGLAMRLRAGTSTDGCRHRQHAFAPGRDTDRGADVVLIVTIGADPAGRPDPAATDQGSVTTSPRELR
jgi:hypothetical protein